ncbi:transglutaminase-like domain-containing protein [Neorhodopirellula lusitana]|uniref:transglutaminase-like domain-containing protein n=1 Tax=Neorhodopirellula lusitana TaxID=445327 RepID=UPI00384F643C
MIAASLNRRTVETVLLAIVSMVTVGLLRYSVEPRPLFLSEMITIAVLVALNLLIASRSSKTPSKPSATNPAQPFESTHADPLAEPTSPTPPTKRPVNWAIGTATALTLTPLAFAILARFFDAPMAFEITALTTFGTVSLALATTRPHDPANQLDSASHPAPVSHPNPASQQDLANQPHTASQPHKVSQTAQPAQQNQTRNQTRHQAMSLVVSGFLTLFATAISDDRQAVWLSIAWMTICVWHLTSNHWERLELCAVENVHRSMSVRSMSVIAALCLCIMGTLFARDRFSESRHLPWSFMPTSGGTTWTDEGARSGVGNGDAAVAAKDHAESFGAVDSDIFLESTQSTLFDMFSDSIGQPKLKNKSERRQGMAPDKVIEAHQRTAKSEKGGSSFSTDRKPPAVHRELTDAAENAVVQWSGATGIRLAMNRYDHFDGLDWSSRTHHRNEKLTRRDHGGEAWFVDPLATRDPTLASPTLASHRGVPKPDRAAVDVSALKIVRLDSTRLPTPMLTSGLHIKDIDRQDFFGIEDDGCYFMPGREKVPPLTVVHLASARIMEDELWERLTTNAPKPINTSQADPQTATQPETQRDKQLDSQLDSQLTPQLQASLQTLAARWTTGCTHPYEKLQAIVSHLREEFVFDRTFESTSGDPISDFLESRRGGDHLFATTAALMARQIGLKSRLATGFYVRPTAMDVAAKHSNVLPTDCHVWPEISLAPGRWFEIEPTPGYQPPVYTPSTWLVVKRFAIAHWPHACILVLVAGLMWATRLVWLEWLLATLYPLGSLVWPRGRLTLAMRVLQTRAKLAGCPRQPGRPQRDWLLALTQHSQNRPLVQRFCNAADRVTFGNQPPNTDDLTVTKELLMHLKIKTFRQLSTEAT